MDNLWSRRTNSGKLSLSTPSNGSNGDGSSRNNGLPKRQGDNKTPAITQGNSVTSPTNGASSAFGLGSGAFASFGSAKTPKTPGNPFDSAMGSAAPKSAAGNPAATGNATMAPDTTSFTEIKNTGNSNQVHQLKNPWTFWYRPPISKAHGYIEYENTLHAIATVKSVEEFWEVYSFLKRPSTLPVVSDYHLFKKDIRPIWEDDINKKGGKWVVRIKKGIADRYWESLVLALIGDQFGDASDEVCGAVLSIRNGEDILSIWTRTDRGRVLKIREIMKHILNFPQSTRLEFKTHDSSIQQRTAIDEQRREKQAQNQTERRNPSGTTSRHGLE